MITSSTVKVHRVDCVRFDKHTFRKDGSLVAEAALTRVGVFTYKDASGNVVREFRPPEEVGHIDSLKSAQLVPFTNEHPSAMLTVDTIKDYRVGSVGENVVFDGSYVRGNVVVEDRPTLNDVASGKNQISMGYEADVVDIADAMDLPSVSQSPGEWNGEKYDKVQKNIRYNHGSLVTIGRAGPNVKLRLDSALSTEINMAQKQDAEMREVEIPGFGPLEVPIEAAVALAMLIAEKQAAAGAVPAAPELPAPAPLPAEEEPAADEMGGEELPAPGEEEEEPLADKKDSELVKLRAKNDALMEELKALKAAKSKEDAADNFGKAVRNRVQLERDACKVAKCDHTAFAKMTDIEIRKHALKTIGAKYDADDAYVVARFDAAVEMLHTDSSTKSLADKVEGAKDNKADKADKKDSKTPRWQAPLLVSKQR